MRNLESIQNEIQGQDKTKEGLKTNLKEQENVVATLTQDEAKLLKEIDTLKRTNADEEGKRKQLQQDNMELGKELKARHEELKTWQSDKDKLQKTFDQLKRKKALDDEARLELELSR